MMASCTDRAASPVEALRAFHQEMIAIRRDLHTYPEIGFEEFRTSALVAERLGAWGLEVHREIGRTGVVGLLRNGDGPTIALRADMDALPIQEETGLPYASRRPGRFHGCGHDGHTAMLLGAARYLAGTKRFTGTAMFVFQPAEEGLGGARAMIADGLFERFPCDEIYGLHNDPGKSLGRIACPAGPFFASADFVDIAIRGRGAHGAMPEKAVDPVVIAATAVQALQTIISRNVPALQAAVLSITKLSAGTAYNVIPEVATLGGTIRSFDADTRAQIAARIGELAGGLAQSFDAAIEVTIKDIFSVLENHTAEAAHVRALGTRLLGEAAVETQAEPRMVSEDFADMLKHIPGAYFLIGHGGAWPLHHPRFILDDEVLPLGAGILAGLVEERCGADKID